MVLSQVLTSSNTVYTYIYIYLLTSFSHFFLHCTLYTIRCTLYVNITVLHHTSYRNVAKEIHGLMLKLGEELTPHEVEVMLNVVDTDGDGQISFGEFYRHITKDPNGVFLESANPSPR